MMQMVVDTNFLRSEALTAYLAGSTHNVVVLSDYVGVEAAKVNALVGMPESMRIVAQFPLQVAILKATRNLVGVRPRLAGLRRRLIDYTQTRAFPEFCRLVATSRSDARVGRQVAELQRTADAYSERLLTAARNFQTGIANLKEVYSAEELRAFRNSDGLPDTAAPKILRILVEGALALLRREGVRVPREDELVNSYAFRLGLCSHLVQIDWLAHGGADGARAERIRNDMVDMQFATCATYFDGLLTNDRKVARMYAEAVNILHLLGVRAPQPVRLPLS